jgi:hypothetical protein
MDTRIDSAVEFQTVLGRCDRPALLNGWAVSLATHQYNFLVVRTWGLFFASKNERRRKGDFNFHARLMYYSKHTNSVVN